MNPARKHRMRPTLHDPRYTVCQRKVPIEPAMDSSSLITRIGCDTDKRYMNWYFPFLFLLKEKEKSLVALRPL